MEILKDRYSISELSERLSITDHALRYYEKEFCLTIPKDDRGRRFYTPELANVMFQIKTMRDEGLEIKAIKRILLSENTIDPPPVVYYESPSTSVTINKDFAYAQELKQFFDSIKEDLISSLSAESASTKEYMSTEISKTKLELGACFENGVRKLESRMDKHFENIDRSIGIWREKNKRGTFKRLISRVFKH